MIVREVFESERKNFNQVVTHPLQSWEWGEFREKTGLNVIRLGLFDGQKIKEGYQITIHPLPKTQYYIGYLPKGPMPNQIMLDTLKKLGQDRNLIMIKLEPNVGTKVSKVNSTKAFNNIHQFLVENDCRQGRPIFTPYTFEIDLTQSETELFKKMKPKTRYNVRLAQKKDIQVFEDNSNRAFAWYLKLLKETAQRQKFYYHNDRYHRQMWESMKEANIAHLLLAKYQGKILVTWILFVFNNVLYYPYGASTAQYKDTMASNLIMWEAIKFGKKMGCQKFDLWGSLGPNYNPKDPWAGFHRFKEGYGGDLIEFLGSYDLVINHRLYPFFRLAENLRWKYLRLKTLFR
jgi:lipid II:glycine glycyltransferase (peptidoglycan interpeptide bridge formation enzyme)